MAADLTTDPVFLRDAYLRSSSAVVLAADPAAGTVVLDRTVCHPGGGGQPADRGWLSWAEISTEITETRRAGEGIVHVLDGPVPEGGTAVEVTVEWDRRYAVMRTHTALHVLCGVAWRDLQVLVTGGAMSPLEGHLDFDLETLDRQTVAQIEQRVNDEIAAERDVRVGFLSRAEAEAVPDLIRTKVNLLPKGLETIRTVEIVGLDLQADGGTHVANTREVGRVRITRYKSKGKSNKRIYIALE